MFNFKKVSLFLAFVALSNNFSVKAAYVEPWSPDEFDKLLREQKTNSWKKGSSESVIKKNLLEKKVEFWNKIKTLINNKNYCKHRVRSFISMLEFLYHRVKNIDKILNRKNGDFVLIQHEKNILYSFQINPDDSCDTQDLLYTDGSDQLSSVKDEKNLLNADFEGEFGKMTLMQKEAHTDAFENFSWEKQMQAVFATMIYQTVLQNINETNYSSFSFIMQNEDNKNLYFVFRMTAFLAYSLLEDICVNSDIFKFLEEGNNLIANGTKDFWSPVRDSIFNCDCPSTHRLLAFCEIVIFIKRFEEFVVKVHDNSAINFLSDNKTNGLVIKELQRIWPKKFETQEGWKNYLYKLMEWVCVKNAKFKWLEAK